MVQVLAIIQAETPEMREQLLERSKDVAAQSRLESGCVSYEIFTSGSRRIVFLEEWESPEALGAHAQGSTFAGLMETLDELGVRDSFQVLPISPVVVA